MLIRNSNLNLALPTLQQAGARRGANVCSSSLDYRVDTFDEVTQTWSSSLGNPIGYVRNGTAEVTKDRFGIYVAFSEGAYIEVSGSLPNVLYFACVTGSSMSATGAGVAGYNWSITSESGQSTFQHIGGTVSPLGFAGNVAEQLVAFQRTGQTLGTAKLTSYLSGINWLVPPGIPNSQDDNRTNSANGGMGSNFRISAGNLIPLSLRAFGFGIPTTTLQEEYSCRYGTPIAYTG